MSRKLRATPAVFFVVFVVAAGSVFAGSASAADRDDHSYLPPWMLSESGEVKKADETPNGASAQADAERLVRTDAQPVAAKQPDSASLKAEATQVKTRVVGFVSNLFKRSALFATGE